MLFANNTRKFVFNYPYIETFGILLFYLGVGYLIDPYDLLMLHKEANFLTILLAIVTLFHGIASGLFAMLLLGLAMHYFYNEFQYLAYLKEMILVLIFGEFHYYWSKQIAHHQTEDNFTRQKLLELSRAFYMLKISHDQIEKSYVLKPMSLRNSIIEIKAKLSSGKNTQKEFFENYLTLLGKTFNIESAFMLKLNQDGNLEQLAQSNKNEEINLNDLLIVASLERRIPIYVNSGIEYTGSSYLASIPALSDDKILGVLVISKMPFMSFTKDNLTSATILITYMFDEMNKITIMQKMNNFLPLFQENFRFEAYKLYRLHRKYKTESTILVFKSTNQLMTHLLIETINKNLRNLEKMSYIQTNEQEIVAILFPFSDLVVADGFVARMYALINIQESIEGLHYLAFGIHQTALIEEYIGKIK